MGMSDFMKVTQLTMTNYHRWKGDIHSALILCGFWPAVEQNAEYAALDAAGKRTMSQKALAVIRMNTSSGLRIHIDSANSAKDAWEALESIFTTESLGAKNRMRDELHALRREEKETAFEFASRAKTLQCRMLDGCGIRVPDDEIIHAVMRGLGPEYTIFKRCMSQTVKSMTLNEFCNRLLEEQPDSSDGTIGIGAPSVPCAEFRWQTSQSPATEEIA